MKKTIKIIDLYNIIAEGQIPKKIKYDVNIFIPKGNGINGFVGYFDEDEILSYELMHYIRYKNLNDEVEILDEEEFEDIEEITIRDKTIGFPNGEWTARNMDKAFSIKINQLIKNQKKIIERLNKEN